ncbi:MAG TPA: cytochrome c biogenesis protein ResB, partial [Yinghuangia sp.]|nr:cytochrome c biogenesis protein ResB [Yinghuangia sp.]
MAAIETDSDKQTRDTGPADARLADHGAADAGMSTAPRQDSDEIEQPVLGVVGWLRWAWRQLTSMRIALILLLMLALASIPGSIFPQRSVDPFAVNDYFRDYPALARWMDRFQLFNVFSSWWFAAIYVLLMISLVGCIIPRVWAHARVLGSRPPKAPHRMERLPAYARWETDADAQTVLAAARGQLKRRRFRLNTADDSLAGEKGYARETGNVLFHVALVGILVAFLVGNLYKGSGNKIVVEGSEQGFANSLAQYDDFDSGPLFDETDMQSFGFKLTKLDQTFERLGEERGAARNYKAEVEYWEGGDHTKTKSGTIKVNEPLVVGDTKVYLANTGYALDITVRDAAGNVAFSGDVVFLDQGANKISTGVVKAADVSPGLQQIGLEGIFAPTAREGSMQGTGPQSLFPELDNPVLYLTAHHGSLGIDSGVPQSVYRLNLRGMEQYTSPDGTPWKATLVPQTYSVQPDGKIAAYETTLPDGSTITVNDVKPWANFEVSSEPGKGLALYSVIAAIAGLVLSLFVRRRRMWVRAVPGGDGRTVVEVAGLTRTE